MKKYNVSKFIGISVLCSLAVALQIIENIIPIIPSVPGGKLGIANAVVLLVLITYGGKYAILLSILKTVIANLLHGGISAMMYGIFGAILSVLAMMCAYRIFSKKLSPIGISIIGAVFHNFGQVLLSSIILQNVNIFSYLPFLMILSLFSGSITGLCVLFALKYYNKGI